MDVISQTTFSNAFSLNENVWIPIKISLKFVPKGPINNIPAMVQIMAWRRSGDKPLSEPMMVILLTHICVTRSQWVKIHSAIKCFIVKFHNPGNHDIACLNVYVTLKFDNGLGSSGAELLVKFQSTCLPLIYGHIIYVYLFKICGNTVKFQWNALMHMILISALMHVQN